MAALFSVRLAAWISDISSANLWLYIISNLLGNILVLLSLSGYIPFKWLWLFVFVSLPLVVTALLNSNVYVSKLLVSGFEFWFLAVLGCLYIVAMVDVFNYDQRCVVLFLWFLGFMTFLLLDASVTPSAKPSNKKIFTCTFSLILWGSVIALSSTGKFVDLYPRILQLGVNADLSSTIHPVAFANHIPVCFVKVKLN